MQLSFSAQALWVLTTLLEGAVCALALRRALYRRLPLFTLYAGVLFSRTLVLWYLYYHSGFDSQLASYFSWSTRDLLIAAGGAVCVELCRVMLAGYRGAWFLARKVLPWVGAAVLVYAAVEVFRQTLVSARFMLTLERGLELAVGVALLSSLLMSARYRIPAGQGPRLIAVGLCFDSLFQVLNNSLLSFWLGPYFSWWNNVRAVSFQVALALWLIAMWKPWPEIASAPAVVSQRIYESLAARVSARLRQLDHYVRGMTRL